jgi:hypothetical protein
MGKQRSERLSGFCVLLLGIIILWQGRHLSVGTLHAPGAGFFPLLLALLLIILSFFLVIPRTKDRTKTGGEDEGQPGLFSASRLGRVSMVFVALLLYFIFLEYLGFVIVSFLLMAFCFVWMARQRWYAALFWAFVSIGLAYLLFDVLLKSNLPRGVLGF